MKTDNRDTYMLIGALAIPFIAIASIVFTFIYSDDKIPCPRCLHFTSVEQMIITDDNDIEFYCEKCQYPFLLINKKISTSGKPSADIDIEVWERDFEFYQDEDKFNGMPFVEIYE